MFNFYENARKDLFFVMDEYISHGFPTDDSRFQQAISTISEYVKLHDKMNLKVEKISSKLLDYKKYALNEFENTGGADIINQKNSKFDYTNLNFEELAKNRRSVRDFGKDELNEEDVLEAIKIAQKSPSSCNRQAAKTYYIKDKAIVEKVIQLQGGLTSHSVNIEGLVLVTGDSQYMNEPREYNQTYIDGGMFAMSLVYALTYKNIATCTLNTCFNIDKDKKMRELLDIPITEDFICFVAIGSFPEIIKYAKSPRDKIEEMTTII